MHYLCDPEVTELDHAFGGEEDVLRLEVAVQDLAVMHVLHREANLHKVVDDLLLGEQPACGWRWPRGDGIAAPPPRGKKETGACGCSS